MVPLIRLRMTEHAVLKLGVDINGTGGGQEIEVGLCDILVQDFLGGFGVIMHLPAV